MSGGTLKSCWLVLGRRNQDSRWEVLGLHCHPDIGNRLLPCREMDEFMDGLRKKYEYEHPGLILEIIHADMWNSKV